MLGPSWGAKLELKSIRIDEKWGVVFGKLLDSDFVRIWKHLGSIFGGLLEDVRKLFGRCEHVKNV